jgi:peptidoglycan biosynthesis protein MviN/MurJ (putative lipid II flippase)
VDEQHPAPDERWDSERGETETERLDRNWSQLLQELRVTQTGVQLLTGFLLTLPFQQRFTQLDSTMRTIYLITVAFSIGSTALLVAPVGMHRLLFRRHRMRDVVSTAHVYAISGLSLLALALAGVTIVIFYAVAGSTAAWIAGGCALVALTAFWFLLPLRHRVDNDRGSGL